MYGAGGQKRVPEDFIKDFRTGYPEFSEQEQIADFLDYKTSQLDTLIAKKQLLIEKLNEKRFALITEAVTKGFNSSAPMKDSGIDWLSGYSGISGRMLPEYPQSVITQLTSRFEGITHTLAKSS